MRGILKFCSTFPCMIFFLLNFLHKFCSLQKTFGRSLHEFLSGLLAVHDFFVRRTPAPKHRMTYACANTMWNYDLVMLLRPLDITFILFKW